MALYELDGKAPQLGDGAWVADSAQVIGNVELGANASIGHQVMLHGCTIGDGSLIGIQAVVLNNAKIGRNCIVGAGSVVTEGKEFPDNSLIVGSPAKAIRQLTDEQVTLLSHLAQHYVDNAVRYQRSFK